MRTLVFVTTLFTLFGCSETAEDSATADTRALSPEDVISPDGDNATENDTTENDALEVQEADTTPEPEPFTPPAGSAPTLLGGTERPAIYHLPKQYSHDTSWPLVILLHGYSSSGIAQDGYFALSTKVSDYGFVLITPDGTTDEDGYLHWNATDACCDFFGKGIDDVTYITELIDEASLWFNIDPKRVSVIGHSNGGYMVYRLACDIGDRLASAISIAGGMWLDDTMCPANSQLSMVVVHSDNDEDVAYEGSTTGDQQYKGALDSTAFWAEINACEGELSLAETADLDAEVPGDETEVYRYNGCEAGTIVEHWKMLSATHEPNFTDGVFADRAIQVMLEARRQ
jgi:polyhydroxybutyrate depolymerase